MMGVHSLHLSHSLIICTYLHVCIYITGGFESQMLNKNYLLTYHNMGEYLVNSGQESGGQLENNQERESRQGAKKEKINYAEKYTTESFV